MARQCCGRRANGGWRCLGVAVILALLLVVSPVAADWENDCPQGCKCTYSSNRKLASCQDAGFSTVPAKLSSEVQELNLNGNNIIYLEKDAFKKAGLVNLQKLYLEDNGIRTVHKDAFRDLGILIKLDLQRNNIDKIHPHTFTGLGKLRELDLSNNQLSRLDGVQFPVLPHLRKLYLNNNNLNYIHNYAFTNLHILDTLRLAENQLKLIQPALFTNNSLLGDLVLEGNLWECDCRLKPLVSWVKQRSLLQAHVACHSPERVSGRRWEAISTGELACRPQFRDMAKHVPAALGQNATLTCRAYGEPLPQFKWVLNGRVLTNMSVIPFSQPEQTYIVHEGTSGEERYSQLTVTHVADHDFTHYTCVADNLAGLVEQNITLVAADIKDEGPLTQEPTADLYIIIGIVAGAIILIILCTICICCCIRRRSNGQQSDTAKLKLNGSAGVGRNFEHKNVLIVNPVEKPPRQYEQVPQTDLEMSTLVGNPGGYICNDDSVDYPGDPSVGVPHLHRGQLPLATLEEEDDDLHHQDPTLTLDSTRGQSVLGDYGSHFPDLLDMTRGPRAISPTQLSYHSLAPTHVTPQHGGNDHWRYSYVDPNSAYAQFPVAFVSPTPIQQPRQVPGYVTLPRRQRTPSWAGETSNNMSNIMSPQGSLKENSKDYTIYDTLGPRTTADGTSRTDLTRPGSRLADPYSPRTPTTPASPPNNLPPYYAPLLKEKPSIQHPGGRLQHPRGPGGNSSTLPRSTPNLLDGDSSGLSLPYHHGATPVAHSTMLDSSQPQANSPTPSTASTVRTASPAHRLSTTCPPSSASPLHNGHYTSNESSLDSPGITNNNNNPINSKNLANLSMDSALSMGSSAPSLIMSGTGKKVPPKPPPKPSAKRLSIASNSSEPRKASITGSSRVFQDEGPDGTEV